MAKVLAPLLSLDASGTFARSLVFAKHTGRQTVKRKRVSIAPFDPKTEVQLFNRDYFSRMVAVWKALTNEEKRYLDNMGKSVAYSGFNYYIKQYRERHPTDCGVTACGFSELGDLTV